MMMDDPGVSFSSSFCSYQNAIFISGSAWLGACCCCCPRVPPFSKASPPPTKSPAPQSELYNVILHTHKVPRPLVQRLHTLFSAARLTRSSLFLDSIDEWNEQKHSQCVCVHLSVEGIACTFFKTIVSLHKPPTFWGKLTIFHFFLFFFRK